MPSSLGRLELLLGADISRLRKDLKDAEALSRASGEKFAKAFSGGIDGITAEIGQVKAQLKTLGGDVRGAQELRKQSAVLQEQVRLKQQLANIRGAGLSKADADNAERLARELNRLNIQKIDADFRGLGGSIKLTNEAMLTLAGTAGTLAGAFGLAAKAGLSQFVELEGSVRAISAISGQSTDELKPLTDEIERLGLVSSKAPGEVGRTAVSLTRAGFAAEESAAALEGIVRASEATGESLEVVGDIAAKTLRAFGLAAEESGRVADLLTATAGSTNTTVNGLGDSLAYVSAVAAGANQPVEDILVLIGLLGDAGIQGSAAGTNLAAAFERLKTASAIGSSQFPELARGGERLQKAFDALATDVRNSDGSLNSLLDVLPDLKQNIDGLSQADQDILFKTLFGVEGGRAIQVLLNTTDERLQEVTQSIRESEGAAAAAGEVMLTGLGGALSLITGQVGLLAAKFGEFLAIGIEPLVRGASLLINIFLGLPEPIQQAAFAVVALGGALAAATTALALYEALSIRTRVATVANTVATLANVGATKGIATAKAAAGAAQAAYAALSALLTTRLTAETAALIANTAATKAKALASLDLGKGLKTVGTAFQSGSQALTAYGPQLLLLAKTAFVVVGAYVALSEIYNVLNSEAEQNDRANRKTVKSFLEQRKAADEAAEGLSGFREIFDKIQSAADRGGAFDGIRAALIELNPAISKVADSTSRFGETAFTVFGKEFGVITNAQKQAQTDILSTTESIEELRSGVQNTSDFLAQFGQAIKGSTRELSGAELEEFTEKSEEQVAALQMQIEALESLKTASGEAEQLRREEIALAEKEIQIILDRVAAQGESTDALEAEARAIRGVGEALDEIATKYDRTRAQGNLASERRLADLDKAVASGRVSAEDAAKEANEEQFRSAVRAGKAAREQLSDLKALRAAAKDRPDLEDGELQKLDDQIIEAEAAIVQATRDAAQARIKENERAAKESVDAEKKAQRERLDAVRAANAAILAEIDQDRDDEVIQVREAQLAGEIDPDEAAARIVDAQLEASQRVVDAKEAELSTIAQLEREGVLTALEAASERQNINADISQQSIDILEAELAEKERLREEELAQIEQANQRAEAELQRSQTERIAAIRQAQLSGGLGEADAADQVRAIEQQAAAQRVELRRQELAQVRELRDQGVLDAETAAGREIDLQQQIADANLQRLEQEIQARREARQREIDETLGIQAQQADIGIQSQRGEQSLLNAQAELATATGNLAVAQLETQIAQAEAAGDSAEAERLRGQILGEQRSQMELQFKIQRAQLKLTQEIQRAELERERINAQIALATAQAEGASQEIIDLQRQRLALVDEAIGRQSQIEALQNATLEAQQGITAEQQKQKEISAEQAKQEQERARLLKIIGGELAETDKEKAIQALDASRERLELAAKAGLVEEDDRREFQQAQSRVRGLLGASDERLLAAAIEERDNEIFNELLKQAGRGDIVDLAAQARPESRPTDRSEQSAPIEQQRPQPNEAAQQGQVDQENFTDPLTGIKKDTERIADLLAQMLQGGRIPTALPGESFTLPGAELPAFEPPNPTQLADAFIPQDPLAGATVSARQVGLPELANDFNEQGQQVDSLEDGLEGPLREFVRVIDEQTGQIREVERGLFERQLQGQGLSDLSGSFLRDGNLERLFAGVQSDPRQLLDVARPEPPRVEVPRVETPQVSAQREIEQSGPGNLGELKSLLREFQQIAQFVAARPYNLNITTQRDPGTVAGQVYGEQQAAALQAMGA